MPVLEDADTEGNKEDVAVMEEAAEDLFPQIAVFFFFLEEGASRNMLAKVEKLVASLHKSLGNVKPDILPSPMPLWEQIGTKSCKTFPEQIECAVPSIEEKKLFSLKKNTGTH